MSPRLLIMLRSTSTLEIECAMLLLGIMFNVSDGFSSFLETTPFAL
jgi:hypothetical protein